MINQTEQAGLRERFNPDGSVLRTSQLRMLELLKFLDKVCKENNLEYWLDSGTLLGARRHGGFIPWDDDADICMPRKDALKLKRLLKDEIHEGHIVLQSTDTDPNYANSSWLTLRDLNSSYIQDDYAHNKLKYKGLQVDIFMMESRVPGIIKKIASILHDFLVYSPLAGKHHLKFLRPAVRASHAVLDHVVYPSLRLLKGGRGKTTYGIGTPFQKQHSESYIYPLGKISFEGLEFRCPNDPDRYLKTLYGDWNRLPEENAIKVHTDQIDVRPLK